MKLAKVLTGILTRNLKVGNASSRSAVAMLEKVVPFLLSPSGLESNAKDVQSFALSTLLEIIKNSSSAALRPFIPDLISHLLALLSSLEPDVINYIHLNADKYNLKRDEIDDARLSMVRGSPMMEAIERCLDFVDDATMIELSSKLEDTMKTAIGLPSKVGTTRVLVSLSTRHNIVFRTHADRFIRLARKQLLDRNDTVSSAFAAACGYLARLASEEEILKLFAYCQQLYFNCEEDRQRKVSGDIVYAVSKYATDRFNSVASAVLPFVFVAKHDGSQMAKTYFQDCWNENVGGSRAVLLYFKEITSLVMRYLDSPRWSVKHTSALAIADLIKSLGGEINDSTAKSIWPVLEKALGGKTWEGKELVLEGLVHFFKSSRILTLDDDIARQIETIVFRESKRNNPTYRRHALACLEGFVEIQRTKELYAEVYGITKSVVEELLSSSSEMDIEMPSGGPSSKSVTEASLACSMGALIKSINPQLQSLDNLILALTQTLNLASTVMSTDGNQTTATAIYNGYRTLDDRLPPPAEFDSMLLRYTNTLPNPSSGVEETGLKSANAERLRQGFLKARLDLIEAMAKIRAEYRSVNVQ